MSSVTFQPYIDQENTPAHGHHSKAHRGSAIRGLGGKVFQSGTTPAATPRRALGDVNSDLRKPTAERNGGLKPQKRSVSPIKQLFKKPVLQSQDPLSSSQRHTKSQVDKKHKLTVTATTDQKVAVKPPEPLPPIERMSIYNETEDLDYKQPAKHLNFSALHKLTKWWPPCSFGTRHDSDNEAESDSENVFSIDLVADALEVPLPDSVVSGLPEADLSLIDCQDLPIPFLDDSIDIEPNLGTLEIYAASTPLERSPSRPVTQ